MGEGEAAEERVKGRGGGKEKNRTCIWRNMVFEIVCVHRDRPCPFLRLVFCQECVASDYAVYMTV